MAIVVRRHQIEYLRPATLGEELQIETWASDRSAVKAIRHYIISRAATGERVARFRSTYVWVDTETMKPMRIPDQFVKDLLPNFT